MPIQVDEQARMGGQKRGRVQTMGQKSGHLCGADIPGDMARELGFGESQAVVLDGDVVRRVLAQETRLRSVRPR